VNTKTVQIGQSATLNRPVGQKRSQQNSLDEVADMLKDVATDLHPTKQQLQQAVQRKFSNPRAGISVSGGNDKSPNPFETINQERLNPSRVQAIHNMFEEGKSGGTNGVSTWSKKLARNSSKDGSDGGDYVDQKPKRSVNIAPIFCHQAPGSTVNGESGSVKLRLKPVPDKQVPFPTTQPPQAPPHQQLMGMKGVKSTPQNNAAGGHYGTSTVNASAQMASSNGSSSLNRRSRAESILTSKNSASSRAPSIDGDEDCFYDNIQSDNRFSVGDMDDASLCSQNLPPAQKSSGGRIGQLIRRIGGAGASLTKPPVQSAASLVSLNKVSNDTLIHPRHHVGLMKSNSLSNEPWKIHAMEKDVSNENRSMGIGNRLKQTIFGSKKRLQT
jgi:hypothetical protein